MLSGNQVVKVRKAIESTYSGVCTITEYQEFKRENKSTGKKEVVVLENQPCRLSFSGLSKSREGESATAMSQVVKVFLAPEIVVAPGSKITVTQNGRTTEYKNSGVPAVYATHQEIILELFKGWT